MAITESQATRFLLGRLSEQERSELEERVLEEDEALDLLEATECDLVDAYVLGELTAADRRAFEEHLGVLPRVQERIATARALARAGETAPSGWWWTQALQSLSILPPRRWVLAVTTALLIVGVVVVLSVVSRVQPPSSSAEELVVLLVPVVRAEQAREPVEVTGHDRVVLQLDLERAARFESLRGQLRRGGQLTREEPLEAIETGPGQALVEWRIPARELRSGSHVVSLYGVLRDSGDPAPHLVAHYAFSVD